MKISKSKDWELDYKWQHVGCNGDLNEIGIYKLEKSDSTEDGEFFYEVRSANDPLIFLRENTNAGANFSLPSTTWKIMGVVLIFISIFLSIQPIIYFKKRRSGELPESPKLVEFTTLKK